MFQTEVLYNLFKYASSVTVIVCIMSLMCTPITLSIKHGQRTSKVSLGFFQMLFILIFLSSLRYNVGSDYMNYMNSSISYYKYFGGIKELLNFEMIRNLNFQVGFPALSVISHTISKSPYFIFFLISCIIYIPTVWYFKKNSNDSYYSFVAYLLFGLWGLSLNILKQAIAMVFILYAFECFKEKKIVKFAIFSVLSVLFHTSAALVVFIILFYKIVKPTINHLTILTVGGFVLRVTLPVLFKFLSRISIFSRYANLYSDTSSSSFMNRSFIMLGVIIETAFIVIILFLSIKKIDLLIKLNKSVGDYISFIMIGIPFSILGMSKTLWIINRFAKFFFQFVVILFPLLISKASAKEKTDVSGSKKEVEVLTAYGRIGLMACFIVWHFLYSVLMLDNNSFSISSWLFTTN